MKQIINAIIVIINLFIQMIQTIRSLMLYIPKIIIYLINLLGIVPPLYTTFAMATVAVYVLYQFLGRDKAA